jgi:hypothetical protein
MARPMFHEELEVHFAGVAGAREAVARPTFHEELEVHFAGIACWCEGSHG